MKCVCGYKEPKYYEEKVEVFYQSGSKKGQLKKIETVEHHVREEDKFKKILIERDFGFQIKPRNSWYDNESVDLYACPECGTIKMMTMYG